MGLKDTNHWETAIAEVRRDDVIIRGYKLTEMIGKLSYSEMMYLIIKGQLPTPGETRVLDALLVSVMDHGISPSSVVTRLLASYGVPIQVGIAAGILTFGDIHGGAGQQLAMKFSSIISKLEERGEVTDEILLEEARKLVEESRAKKVPIEGFGHPQHGADPRPPILFDIAKKEGVFGKYSKFVLYIEQELQRVTGKSIPVNIDGASAALLLDLGFPKELARLMLIAPRVVGLATHFVEEIEQGNVWRHVPNTQVTYTGKQP